ncbi:hypothetical protein, partial [Aeromonas veronii]
NGGTPYLSDFIKNYRENYSSYQAPEPKRPTIIILDNDDGLPKIIGSLQKEGQCRLVNSDGETTLNGIPSLKKTLYVHVCCNLYLLIIPNKKKNDT